MKKILNEAFTSPYPTTLVKRQANFLYRFTTDSGGEYQIGFMIPKGLGTLSRRVTFSQRVSGNTYRPLKKLDEPMRFVSTLMDTLKEFSLTSVGRKTLGFAIELPARTQDKVAKVISRIIKKELRRYETVETDWAPDPKKKYVWVVKRGVDPVNVFDGAIVPPTAFGSDIEDIAVADADAEVDFKDLNWRERGVMIQPALVYLRDRFEYPFQVSLLPESEIGTGWWTLDVMRPEVDDEGVEDYLAFVRMELIDTNTIRVEGEYNLDADDLEGIYQAAKFEVLKQDPSLASEINGMGPAADEPEYDDEPEEYDAEPYYSTAPGELSSETFDDMEWPFTIGDTVYFIDDTGSRVYGTVSQMERTGTDIVDAEGTTYTIPSFEVYMDRNNVGSQAQFTMDPEQVVPSAAADDDDYFYNENNNLQNYSAVIKDANVDDRGYGVVLDDEVVEIYLNLQDAMFQAAMKDSEMILSLEMVYGSEAMHEREKVTDVWYIEIDSDTIWAADMMYNLEDGDWVATDL